MTPHQIAHALDRAYHTARTLNEDVTCIECGWPTHRPMRDAEARLWLGETAAPAYCSKTCTDRAEQEAIDSAGRP